MNELAVRTEELNAIQQLGQAMAASGFFKDAEDAPKAVVKILAGQELGIPPVAAMRGVQIVKGKIELAGTMIGALIKRSGKYDYRVTENTDERCSIQFYSLRSSVGGIGPGSREKIGETTWTVDDAVRAKLCSLKDGKPYARSQRGDPLPWETYPRTMLFNRAMSEGARTHVPDVFSGPIYSEGEIVDTEGIDVESTVPRPNFETSGVEPQETGPKATSEVASSDEAAPVESSSAPESSSEEVPDATPGDPSEPSPDSLPDAEQGTSSESTPPPSAAEIAQLIKDLGWRQGNAVVFAREHVGKQVTSAHWSTLSDEDRTKLAEALCAELEKKGEESA